MAIICMKKRPASSNLSGETSKKSPKMTMTKPCVAPKASLKRQPVKTSA